MVDNTINERIGVHKVALCFLEKFGWLEREQYVADYGIDIQVEIVESGYPTGFLYCLQVKSGKSYVRKTSQNTITYYPEDKHVNYWLNHVLPVLLVIYNPESDMMYWDFVTRKNILKTENGWKIDIPEKNQLGTDESIEKIRSHYFSDKHFSIVESGIDNSYGLSRKIATKIIIKGNISNIIIENQIPKFIEGLKKSDYYRSEIVERHFQDQPADCVWIWFYRSLEQYKNGLPFCTAYWNAPDSQTPTKLPHYDKKVEDIYIAYSQTELSEEFVNQRLSKGKFLKIIDQFLSETNRMYEHMSESYEAFQATGNASLFKQTVLSYKPLFESLLPDDYRQNFPPLECVDLNRIIQLMEASIDNIFIVANDPKRTDANLKLCVKMYLKAYAENIEPAKYERRKVI